MAMFCMSQTRWHLIVSIVVASKNCKIAQRFKKKAKETGPFANNAEAAMEDVYTYLENRDGVCQFPLNKLLDQIKGPEKRQSKLI